ncbi:MAG: GIY-YIG nuclease family protein, partial [Bdellovibrionaceae bacterium]|nr:GIY-YIG nuclease family protein [Pseudobdellovibrionaceae bacterium]
MAKKKSPPSDQLIPTEDRYIKLNRLKNEVSDFPTQSGVYLMKNDVDKIIYVGKAKVIRNRVKSYLQESKDHSAKTRALVHNICSIEYILTKTEVEAFLLEASLIKKHRPKYNIRLKDDKAYPYIKLSWTDKFPRLYLARKVQKDGSDYFGPYTSGGAVFGTIRFLNRIFKIRDCTDSVFKSRTRPCMTHQIGRCTAPCVDLITQTDYKSDVEGAR